MSQQQRDSHGLMARLGWLLATDFCPSANRWVYWFKHPLVCLVLIGIASASLAMTLRPVAWVVTIAVAFVVLVGCCWPWISIRGLRCRMRFDRGRAVEGEAVEVVLTITSRWPWPVWGLTVHGGFLSLEPDSVAGEEQTATALSRVPGWSTSRWRFSFRPACFGEYPVTPPEISTGFPFGLWRCGRPVDVESRLLVWPATVPVGILPDACGTARESDRFSETLVGDFGDLTGTRPFRDGDSLRRVHWAQTARHDRLVVCERQSAVLSEVKIVLHTGGRLHSAPGPQGTLARAIRIAASLCRAWHAEHAPIVLQLDSRTIPLGAGLTGLHSVFDALARVPHSGTNDGGATRGVGRTRRAEGLCVQVTTDRGWEELPVTPGASGALMTIVLDTSDPDASGAPAENAATLPPRRRGVAWLSPAGDPVQEFQREWRRVCREI